MSVEKKSLISNRSAVKKALVAKSAGKVAKPSKIATPYAPVHRRTTYTPVQRHNTFAIKP